MKKIIALMLSFIVVTSVFTPVAAADRVAGDYFYTDIVTYIWGVQINAINIDGRTLVDAESMREYGFTVNWHEDRLWLEIIDNNTQTTTELARSGALIDMRGRWSPIPVGQYYHTNVRTTLNGRAIEAYNLDGRTFIYAEGMRRFGYEVAWNGEALTLRIQRTHIVALPEDFFDGVCFVDERFEFLAMLLRIRVMQPFAGTNTDYQRDIFSNRFRRYMVSDAVRLLYEMLNPLTGTPLFNQIFLSLVNHLIITDGKITLADDTEILENILIQNNRLWSFWTTLYIQAGITPRLYLEVLADELNKVYAESDFNNFFLSYADYYAEYSERFIDQVLNDIKHDWFIQNGIKMENINIIISPSVNTQNTLSTYPFTSFYNDNERNELVISLAIPGVNDYTRFTDDVMQTYIKEMSHVFFVNMYNTNPYFQSFVLSESRYRGETVAVYLEHFITRLAHNWILDIYKVEALGLDPWLLTVGTMTMREIIDWEKSQAEMRGEEFDEFRWLKIRGLMQ
jgi:hypothetical protein